MQSLWLVGVIAALIGAILVNEVGYQGRLFPSAEVGSVGGFCVLAAAFALRAGTAYQGKWAQAARHAAIWAVIVAVLAGAYWLFG